MTERLDLWAVTSPSAILGYFSAFLDHLNVDLFFFFFFSPTHMQKWNYNAANTYSNSQLSRGPIQVVNCKCAAVSSLCKWRPPRMSLRTGSAPQPALQDISRGSSGAVRLQELVMQFFSFSCCSEYSAKSHSTVLRMWPKACLFHDINCVLCKVAESFRV